MRYSTHLAGIPISYVWKEMIEDIKSDFPIMTCKSDNVRVVEDDVAYIFTMELCGFKKDEISISYDGEKLSIEAKNIAKNDSNDKKVLCNSCSKKNVSESYYFEGINSDKISADLEDGILTLFLPKNNETKVKNIKIT